MKKAWRKKKEKQQYQTLKKKDGTLTKSSTENLEIWKEWVKENFYKENTEPKIEYVTENEINNNGIFSLLNEEDKYKEYREEKKGK